MKSLRLAPFICIAAALFMATPSHAQTTAPATRKTVSNAPQVDNPTYTSWAKFKPGTTVSVSQIYEDSAAPPANAKHEMTVNSKLIAVKPDTVIIERTSINVGGGPDDRATETIEIPAKIDKGQELASSLAPAGIGPEDGPSPTVKDDKVGKETLQVAGNKIDAITHEFTMEVPGPQGISAKVKTWTSQNVPGNLIKVELTRIPPDKTSIKTSVTDFKAAK